MAYSNGLPETGETGSFDWRDRPRNWVLSRWQSTYGLTWQHGAQQRLRSSLLVTRHICFAPQTMEEPWLCTHVFQSTCTVKGKVCTFIIDYGSSHNIVSDYAVRKLGLEKEVHPTPYKLTWLKTEIRVTHRTLVSFSIGSVYKDQLYCILPQWM